MGVASRVGERVEAGRGTACKGEVSIGVDAGEEAGMGVATGAEESRSPEAAEGARVERGSSMVSEGPSGLVTATSTVSPGLSEASAVSILSVAPSPGMSKPKPRTARPPTMPTAQVAVTKVAMPFLGITLASPQKVMGPPAAAANRRVAAGAVPIPSSSSSATRGISNRRGTLIRRPKVAAMATPNTLLPR